MGSDWYHDQRQMFISEMLRVVGYINRKHLTIKFGISEQLARQDLCDFREQNPKLMEYDAKEKRFNATGKRPPAIDRLLSTLTSVAGVGAIEWLFRL